MTRTDLTAESQVAHDRRLMASYYAWGREDTGDRRMRKASHNRVVVLDFADFAAAQAADYAAERATSLPAVQDQYARYLAAITIGARHTHKATGTQIEVTAYDDTNNTVEARTLNAPDHPTRTYAPADLAGPAYQLTIGSVDR